jgi:hypothetical protein
MLKWVYLGYIDIKVIAKINSTYFSFSIVIARKFKIKHMACILLLLDSTDSKG